MAEAAAAGERGAGSRARSLTALGSKEMMAGPPMFLRTTGPEAEPPAPSEGEEEGSVDCLVSMASLALRVGGRRDCPAALVGAALALVTCCRVSESALGILSRFRRRVISRYNDLAA